MGNFIRHFRHNFNLSLNKNFILVPSSFTQNERLAVLRAAKIADLNTLNLVEDNTAALIQFMAERPSIFQGNNEGSRNVVLIYNLGSSSLQVSIASCSSHQRQNCGLKESIDELKILGKAWDSSIGGFYFDARIAKLLEQRLGVTQSDIHLMKLLNRAKVVKEILSVNQECPVKIEQVDGKDLGTVISRKDMESFCSDLFDNLVLPIDEALRAANLTKNDVHIVELIGGGSRMPKVKSALDQYFSNTKAVVGAHLNGDECIALGATLSAANQSAAFKVRETNLIDITNDDFIAKIVPVEKRRRGAFKSLLAKKKLEEDPNVEHEVKCSNSSHSKIEFTIFPPKTALGTIELKSFTLNTSCDILCKIEYNTTSNCSSIYRLPRQIQSKYKVLKEYKITGVESFCKEVEKENGLEDQSIFPNISLNFSVSNSGIVELLDAEAEAVLEVKHSEIDSSEISNISASLNGTGSVSVFRKKLGLVPAFVRHYSAERIDKAKKTLQEFRDYENIRLSRAAAMNELEAFVYKVKNTLRDDNMVDYTGNITSAKQREELLAYANEIEDWLYDEEQTRNTLQHIFDEKKEDLVERANIIFNNVDIT